MANVMRAFSGFFVQKQDACGDAVQKSQIVFHQNHGRAVYQNHVFDLDARNHVYVVERLVPYVEVRFFAEACRKKRLFFLPG